MEHTSSIFNKKFRESTPLNEYYNFFKWSDSIITFISNLNLAKFQKSQLDCVRKTILAFSFFTIFTNNFF